MTESVLSDGQRFLLDAVGKEVLLRTQYYLTGGTALAEYYLHHRYSEDLDFFSEQEVDVLGLNVFFAKLHKNGRLRSIDYQQSFNRNIFFCHFSSSVVKTEFTFFPFRRIENSEAHNGLMVDGTLDIAVNKLFTIYQRSHARDYIDLFCLCKNYRYTTSNLIGKAKSKFDWHIDPLQLGTQFLKAREVRDYPRMIQNVAREDWQQFFVTEAKKLKKEILE